MNAGRKPVPASEASPTIIRVRAIELSRDQKYNNVKVLELALKILKRTLEMDANGDGSNVCEADEPMHSDEPICQPDKGIVNHTKESALALVLELGLSKNSYIELARDMKSRGCPVFPCWDYLKDAKEGCTPKNYRISEVEFIFMIISIHN